METAVNTDQKLAAIMFTDIISYTKRYIKLLKGMKLYEYWKDKDYLSRREDLNLRPLRPERSALPDCATPRFNA